MKIMRILWLCWAWLVLVFRRLSHANNHFNDINKSTSKYQRQQEVSEDTIDKDALGKRLKRSLRSLNISSNPSVNTTRPLHVNEYGSTTNSEISPTKLPLFTFKNFKPITYTWHLPKPSTNKRPTANCRGSTLSCTDKCTNTTTFNRFTTFDFKMGNPCSCDRACNEIFEDCCSDYAEMCVRKVDTKKDIKDVISDKSMWRCETELNIIVEGCKSVPGVWMISRCPSDWPNDDVKQRCHGATSKLDFKNHDQYTPVVGSHDQLTYRNIYCAKCNNVSKFEFWNLIFDNKAVPPPFYTLKEFLRFLSLNSHYFKGVTPVSGQRIRWCHFVNIVNTCSVKSHSSSSACVNGTVSLVKSDFTVYKNKDCALCNNVRATCDVEEINVFDCNTGLSPISRIINLRDYSSSVEKTCLKDQVFDTYLKKCRQSYKWSSLIAGSNDRYHVTVFILKTISNEYFDLYLIKNEIAMYFKFNNSQININKFINKLDEYIITFDFTLTPSQSLILASDPYLLENTTENIGLRRLFKFEQAFSLPLTGKIVYKLVVRQVICTRKRIYKFGEYTILDDLRIRVDSTGSVYQQNEYFLNTTQLTPNVSVCLKFPSLTCNGSFIKLNNSEYHIAINLTLIYHSLRYKIDEYLYLNKSVFICVKFKNTYTSLSQQKESLALIVITWFGFIVSIICLLALLVTYIMFQELRTLPGKNLINLSSSLCLAEMLWLSGSSVDQNQVGCIAVAIANHYFFLVFFMASFVVAFHSSLVFGRKISLRKSKSEENRRFVIYSIIVWGVPALFVLCFSLLDHSEVFDVSYGNTVCWLGTKQSKLFLFILPFGIIILLNICLFVFVAIRLYKNQKSTLMSLGKITRERQKQNVLVCVKLSTLMGFSWIFGLLQVAVENKTDVFAYLFVIFVSFQGVFICMAFLWKRANYKLYSSLISRSGETKSINTRQSSGQQDTQL